MIYADGEIVSVPRGKFGGRPNEVGDHVETPYGWGRVVKIQLMHRGMLVATYRNEPTLPRQDFPEWDLMRRAERFLARQRAEGRTDR